MSANLTGINGEEVIRNSLKENGGKINIVHVSPSVLGKYIKIAHQEEESVEEINVLGSEETLKTVMNDFLVSSAASDLIKKDKLEVKTGKDGRKHSLVIVGNKSVISYVELNGVIGALASNDDSFIQKSLEVFNSLWKEGESFKIRTPPITDVRKSLQDEIGDETEKDFTAMLESLETAKGNGEGLDEITVALLSAAKNQILLYDISKWGEDSGVASKATFSRKKTELENKEVIDTENVPIDIGRPRLRLKFVDDDLEGAGIDKIIERAKQKLHK